jgi:hypothetical protein
MSNGPSAELLGLASGSLYGSFTANRSTISLIYDAMKVEWNNGGAEPERMPSTSFAIVASPDARGRTIELDLRGFSTPAGAGSVTLDVGGARLTAAPAEEEYYAKLEATLSADSDTTRVIATLDLPKPEDGAATMLTLDSIDVALPECSSRKEG